MKIKLIKRNGYLLPLTEEDQENIDKLKSGEIYEVDIKKKRAIGLFRKWWALLDIAYNVWEPGEINSQYGTPQKTMQAFREWITIKAGFYDVYSWPNGKIRIEAKSVAFGNMSEEDFKQLYSNTIDICLQDILHNYTKDDLEQQVQLILGFT